MIAPYVAQFVNGHIIIARGIRIGYSIASTQTLFDQTNINVGERVL